jgi:hypothetical protein
MLGGNLPSNTASRLQIDKPGFQLDVLHGFETRAPKLRTRSSRPGY